MAKLALARDAFKWNRQATYRILEAFEVKLPQVLLVGFEQVPKLLGVVGWVALAVRGQAEHRQNVVDLVQRGELLWWVVQGSRAREKREGRAEREAEREIGREREAERRVNT